MTRTLRIIAAIVTLAIVAPATATRAGDQERGVMTSAPPIEPSYLFTIPTGKVIRSMDLDVSASGVLFGERGSTPLGRVVLGLGDIAQMDYGSMAMVSGLDVPGDLVGVPAVGLKVYLPLWKYAHGLAASFRRSGSYAKRAGGIDYETKLGEFCAVTSFANFIGPDDGVAPHAGWNGIKVKGHAGLTYVDASLQGRGEVTKSFWRPIGGIELWKSDARARIIGELSWMAGFERDPAESIQPVRVLMGGVRFFFSKHTTFDIGIRHQDNYGGIADSAIQTKLHFSIPTHVFRDRVVGR